MDSFLSTPDHRIYEPSESRIEAAQLIPGLEPIAF